MAQEKPPPAKPPLGPLKPLLFLQSRAARLALLAVILIAFGLGVKWLWDYYRQVSADDPTYRLTAESIRLEPPPPQWVRSDIRGETIVLGSLENADSRETDLAQRILQAFTMHPWIEEVVGVAKSPPNRVEVRVVYRRPVAMVVVAEGLLPIDRQAVLLRTGDFQVEDVPRFLRIEMPGAVPSGTEGARWEDRRVEESARIAEALLPIREDLQLHRIRLLTASTAPASGTASQYEIVDRNDRVYVWGRAPGREVEGEPTLEQKIARLQRIVQGEETPPNDRSPVRLDKTP